MAIQTQGHQVQVMPTYSPVDPNRVSFDLSGLTNGAMSSIQLINALAQQKAFAQAQAELAATREGRLGATNAQNLATIQLAPQKNLADIALAQQQAQLIPGQTEAALAGQDFSKVLRPFLQNVERQKAETADALSVANADKEIKQSKIDAEKQDREIEAAPLEHQKRLIQLNQDINSIADDKKLNDTEKLAKIRQLNAQSANYEAEARKNDRAEGKIVDPIKELSQLQLEIQRLQSTPVINPGANNNGTPMPVLQYEAQTRGPDGKVLKVDNPYWFTGDSPAKLNPEAERIRDQLKILQDRRDSLTKALISQSSAPAPIAASAPAQAPAAPSSPKELIDAVRAGKISKEQAKEYATSKGWK